MTILAKARYELSSIPIKVTVTFFIKQEKKDWNLYGNTENSEY